MRFFIFRGFIGANGVVASFEEDSKFYLNFKTGEHGLFSDRKWN